ncbi:ATP-binding protein [Streptomyces shenzhenensis]|uniref:ATP-binding protein n=1 Tax=Streptomyces shenzhenensis TaxID=943815 RepID=UPI003D8B900B
MSAARRRAYRDGLAPSPASGHGVCGSRAGPRSQGPVPRSEEFGLPAGAACVAQARCLVGTLLAGWGLSDEPADDAILVLSELVTNAIAHSGGSRITCRVHVLGGRVRIEVEDERRGASVPAVREPDVDDQGGRGLLLVSRLSDAWGVGEAPDGKGRVVWADVEYEGNGARA